MSGEQSPSVEGYFPMPGSLADESTSGQGEHAKKPASGQVRPVKMRRNIFGPSDASLARPESSRFAAEGTIPMQGTKSTSSKDVSTRRSSQHTSETILASSNNNKNPVSREDVSPFGDPPCEVNVLTDKPESMTADQSAPSKENPVENITPNDETATPSTQAAQYLPPKIQVQSPSNSAFDQHTPRFGISAMESASSMALPIAPRSSPALSDTIPKGVVPLEAALSLPGAISEASKGMPVPGLSGNIVGALPGLKPPLDVPLGGHGIRKRTRAVRKARKILVRRRLLAVLLGKELGNITHAQLSQAQNLTGQLPVPLTL